MQLKFLPSNIKVNPVKPTKCPKCNYIALHRLGTSLVKCSICNGKWLVRKEAKQLPMIPSGIEHYSHRYTECPTCGKFKLKRWNKHKAICFNCGNAWRL